MATFEPPFLPIGTEVSAKYRGAFCEAKVKKAVKLVRLKVVVKESQSSVFITDEHVVSGLMKIGNVVEFKHPETSHMMEGIVSKVTDNSTYTVVFNDGDERTLRRTQLCLKGDKHFEESETLDNLPLSHPEHFGTPVLKKQKAVRGRAGDSESEKEDSSSDEDSKQRASYKSRHQELVGKVMLVEVVDKRKGALTPVLVVLPDAHPIELKNRDHLLVRSFRDTKFMAVNRKDLKDFARETAIKNEDKAMKAAFEKALLYYDGSELPINWNREELLGPDEEEGEEGEETSDDDEQCEEKDLFVAQLYKFMDDRGTPINKGPCIGNKDLNLYRLFRVVQNIGGYNKATNQMKWRLVYSKMGLPPSNSAAHQIKNAYKKYLHAFEDFYRKLGSTMGTISRPGRQSRHSSSRGILSFRGRDKESSPRSPRVDKAAAKEDKNKEEEKPKTKKEEESSRSEETDDTEGSTPVEESDSEVVRRSTPRREKAQREDAKSEKKEDAKGKKEEEKKEESSKEERKKEEKREERKSLRQSLKEEEKKESARAKEEDRKEGKKEDGKTDRVLRKDLTDKEEDGKKEPEEEKETKKRVTRRKLLRTEDDKKEAEEKEEEEEKGEEKKKEKKERKPPVSAKKEKVVKKKPEEEENESKGKESDGESDTEVTADSKDQEFYPNGTKLKVRYGRGRNQKLYEAKVLEQKAEGPRKSYFVHYAGWNTRLRSRCKNADSRYDEWVRSDSIVDVLNKPELTKLKKKNLAAKAPKITTARAVKPETPLLKKRGRQPSIQQVPSPGGSTGKSTPTLAATEPKTPKAKVAATLPASASKTRSTRSNSTEIKPETPTLPNLKHRITRRSSGIHEESTDEPTTGDAEVGSESDVESESAPASAITGDLASEQEGEEDQKESEVDLGTDEPAESPLSRDQAVDSETPSCEEEAPKAGETAAGSEGVTMEGKAMPVIVPPCTADPSKEVAAAPTALHPSSALQAVENLENLKEGKASKVLEASIKDSTAVAASEPAPTPAAAAVSEEPKEASLKSEEGAPHLTKVKDESVEKRENQLGVESEESKLPAPVLPALDSLEGERGAPAAVAAEELGIPQLKKIDLDLPPQQDEKKEGRDKEKVKGGKKAGRGEAKKGRQNEMRTSLSEIPTLEPMTTPPEVQGQGHPCATGAAAGLTAPSPYDFNDAEVDSPSPWQPEITKKWEPCSKTLVPFWDVKMELKKSLENDKKKVKKKSKKAAEETAAGAEAEKPPPSSVAESPAKVGGDKKVKATPAPQPEERQPDKPQVKKKGRKKKAVDPETKPDTSSYEETVNSVVESCKAESDYVHIPLPASLEPKEEKVPKKRKAKMLEPPAAPVVKDEEKADEGKKETGKVGKGLKSKVGRKKKEVKTTDCGTEAQPLNPIPVSFFPVGPQRMEVPSHPEDILPPSLKQPRLEAELPASDPSPSGLFAPSASASVLKAGGPSPADAALLSMASIRPVPSVTTETSAGLGPSHPPPHAHPLPPPPSHHHHHHHQPESRSDGAAKPSATSSASGAEARVNCAATSGSGELPGKAVAMALGAPSGSGLSPCAVGYTVLDNTPPTTPENDLDEANSGSSSSEAQDALKEDLFSLDSGERTSKGGSESPPGCDLSLSSTSSENLPSSSGGGAVGGSVIGAGGHAGAGGKSSSSVSSETVGTGAKRKRKDEGALPLKKKKRLSSRSTRGERNKKSPKYGDDDSQSHSPPQQNGGDHGRLSPATNDVPKAPTPRPPKFHFADDLGEHLKGEPRIQFLLEKMKEVRKVYQNIKGQVAAIERKRKRARRREKERESSQASSGDKEGS